MILMLSILCVKDSLEDQPQAEGTFLLMIKQKSCDEEIQHHWPEISSPTSTWLNNFAGKVLFKMAGTAVVLRLISLFFCCGKFILKV